MTRSRYKTLLKTIDRDDKHGIVSRWAFGRTILDDPKMMSASGEQLRAGAIESLLAIAKAADTKLSEREIRYRIQCAKAYKTINEIRHACAEFEDWSALRAAGFPVTFVDEVPSPDAVLDGIEGTDPQEFEQLGLFPPMVKSVPLEQASLRVLVSYAEDMAHMTASFARRDEERAVHLRHLCAAVGGDLDVLYPDAVAALASITA